MPSRNVVFLGLDVGDARVGVAISRTGVIAQPLTTLERKGRRQILDALEALVDEHGVSVVVVGLPLLEGGAAGQQARKAQAFARSLQRRLPRLEVAMQDERHSSAQARELEPAPGGKGIVDRRAAAFILQRYLDARPAADASGPPPSPEDPAS